MQGADVRDAARCRRCGCDSRCCSYRHRGVSCRCRRRDRRDRGCWRRGCGRRGRRRSFGGRVRRRGGRRCGCRHRSRGTCDGHYYGRRRGCRNSGGRRRWCRRRPCIIAAAGADQQRQSHDYTPKRACTYTCHRHSPGNWFIRCPLRYEPPEPLRASCLAALTEVHLASVGPRKDRSAEPVNRPLPNRAGWRRCFGGVTQDAGLRKSHACRCCVRVTAVTCV